jgi:hypothetical protein
VVVTSGWLRRALPEWQGEGDRPAEDPVSQRRVLGWLRRDGFEVEEVVGFHGPASILWGYLSRPVGWLGRPDLADRFLFRMRAAYVTGRSLALVAPVGVIMARRRTTADRRRREVVDE